MKPNVASKLYCDSPPPSPLSLPCLPSRCSQNTHTCLAHTHTHTRNQVVFFSLPRIHRENKSREPKRHSNEKPVAALVTAAMSGEGDAQKGSDMTKGLVFEVEGKAIPCNRQLLCERSEFLRGYLPKTNCGTIRIANVSHDACKLVLDWLHGDASPEEALPSEPPLELAKLHKIWELSLRFAVDALVTRCVELLSPRLSDANVCSILQIAYRVHPLPASTAAVNDAFKQSCFTHLLRSYDRIKKTPAFFAMISVSPRIKKDVDDLLEAHKRSGAAAAAAATPANASAGPGTPSKGTAVLLKKLNEQPRQPPSAGTPRGAGRYDSAPAAAAAATAGGGNAVAPNPPPLHRTPQSRGPQQHVPPPLSQAETPSVAATPTVFTAGGKGGATAPGSVRADSVGAHSDVNEPVYEASLVFSMPRLGDPVTNQQANAAPATPSSAPPRHSSQHHRHQSSRSMTPPLSRAAAAAAAARPSPQPRQPAAGGPAESQSPAPQPAVSTPLFARSSTGGGDGSGGDATLFVACLDGAGAWERQRTRTGAPARLATCLEAHTARRLLKDRMDALDGGFLGSFLLRDGKVDGPGFGVPLRFSTGSFEGQCGMAVFVEDAEGAGGVAPAGGSTAVVVAAAGSLDAAGAAAGGGAESYSSEKDSLLLKHYILQQGIRVTSHELELFKNDFLDWEVSLEETNALRGVEEQRLKQRIVQQKRQLLATLYKNMQGALGEAERADLCRRLELGSERGGSASVDAGVGGGGGAVVASDGAASDEATRQLAAEIAAERAELLRRRDALKKRGDTPELQETNDGIESLQAGLKKMLHVKGLIETEIKENEQYEEYSKRYVCAVTTAEQEVKDILHKNTASGNGGKGIARMHEALREITREKQAHEKEAMALDTSTKHLASRIQTETNHIKHIRAFLDETEQQELPSRLLEPAFSS